MRQGNRYLKHDKVSWSKWNVVEYGIMVSGVELIIASICLISSMNKNEGNTLRSKFRPLSKIIMFEILKIQAQLNKVAHARTFLVKIANRDDVDLQEKRY